MYGINSIVLLAVLESAGTALANILVVPFSTTNLQLSFSPQTDKAPLAMLCK